MDSILLGCDIAEDCPGLSLNVGRVLVREEWLLLSMLFVLVPNMIADKVRSA